MSKNENGIWVVTHMGDLIQSVGCKINDDDSGHWGTCFLVLLQANGKEHQLAADGYWSGKTGPVKELKRAQEIIVEGIVNCKNGKFDFRKNKELMRLLRKLNRTD